MVSMAITCRNGTAKALKLFVGSIVNKGMIYPAIVTNAAAPTSSYQRDCIYMYIPSAKGAVLYFML